MNTYVVTVHLRDSTQQTEVQARNAAEAISSALSALNLSNTTMHVRIVAKPKKENAK